MTSTVHDVAVIGAGPVGATLAALLAKRGLSVIVIERDVDVYPLPRAAHLDAETVRNLREIGAWSEAPGWSVVNEGMDFVTADGQLLLRMTATSPSDDTTPQSNLFHQPSLDRLIRDRAVHHGATLLLGHEVVDVRDDGSTVLVTARDLDSRTIEIDASWVVGCCGARSFLRRQMGVSQIDLQFDEPWLVVDVIIDGHDPDPPTRTLQICDPHRPSTVVPMPGTRRRFEFMLLPGENADDVNQSERITEWIAPHLGSVTATVERSAVYTFHGLIAEEWRQGHLLLAGDAAHQMPPFLGQGMCSGIRDAVNLAWKLTAVCRGADDSLLDTYQSERSPHVRRIVESAVGFGRIICTLDVDEAAERDRMMLAARAENPVDVGGSPMPAQSGSPMILEGAGQLVVEGSRDGRTIDEILDGRWAVMAPRSTLDHADREFLAKLDAVVFEGDDITVVRPDRIVFGSGRVALDGLRDVAKRFALVT
ncbi:MAG: bifunctional 3-(3-hydroxy-phenyl)propionate/3-hydroxycinnamic acid hydroxylase [Actinomycetota bacterium]|nr:bifunctional 3-(3-hydroxy-phenyl)propionate/3-hydroxycinnamic acid hydroxylase [Actinomycetota bacterium]MDA2972044.1 bifunctional 3-(3-hydroxy-phenyl)propionate/3-hydroxycinnamic acid hydroxylase [Actinomycetota bacterium]MDA3002207.1 bifunctional 3-(3-hydroxy-phenyl)propionate/3-hydroxycinnamic acid hydroxylase [Actinomycetota bacterium]